MEWVNVWQFSTHTNYFKSTYSSNRFHWTDNLHQRRLICKPHGDWGWPTTLSSGPTHEGWLPIVLRKENDRNKIAYAKTFQAEIDVTTAAPLYHPLTYGWRAWNLIWPIRFQQAAKTSLSWRPCKLTRIALKSSNFSVSLGRDAIKQF